MGRSLKKSTVALDTVCLIYFFEDHSKFADEVEMYFRNIQSGTQQGILASVGLVELLTGLYQKQRVDLVNQYTMFLDQLTNLAIVDTNPVIANQAAVLRGKYNLATPDAIHLATAIFLEADYFLTNDKKLKKVKEIKVKLLTE